MPKYRPGKAAPAPESPAATSAASPAPPPQGIVDAAGSAVGGLKARQVEQVMAEAGAKAQHEGKSADEIRAAKLAARENLKRERT